MNKMYYLKKNIKNKKQNNIHIKLKFILLIKTYNYNPNIIQQNLNLRH